jgi:hypothetical protein
MEPGRCIVLFAGLGVGQLTPMVELAKLFHRRGLAIAVPTVPGPASATASVASEAGEWCWSQYAEQSLNNVFN